MDMGRSGGDMHVCRLKAGNGARATAERHGRVYVSVRHGGKASLKRAWTYAGTDHLLQLQQEHRRSGYDDATSRG